MYENCKAPMVGQSPHQEPQIPAEVSALEHGISSLRDSLSQLEQRLTPVLRPSPTQAAAWSKSEDKSEKVPLANQLSNLRSCVSIADMIVGDILGRLEL